MLDIVNSFLNTPLFWSKSSQRKLSHFMLNFTLGNSDRPFLVGGLLLFGCAVKSRGSKDVKTQGSLARCLTKQKSSNRKSAWEKMAL